ncbi:MAG: N-acetyltransferase [Verrucomicrobiae bacterium]|nr:N-acetyltransferase [Verrucomicrobiae bacterium]
MKIRKATQNDADAIRGIHFAAFPEGERDLVSDVAVKMLSEETSPPVLSLVAEVDDTVIGHITFSPVTSHDTKKHLGYILAPLAVRPSHQKRGIASQLIMSGVQHLSELGSGALLVYGDPDFYSRFGFGADRGGCYPPPYQLEYAFGWQAMALGDFDFPSSSISISCVSSLSNPALW